MAYTKYSAYAEVATEMEKWIKEATNEAGTALKRTEPDDIDYWETVRAYDLALMNDPRLLQYEQDIIQDADEPNLPVGERLIRIGYPTKTEYAARMDINYRDMKGVKRWAKNNLPAAEFNKTWNPCHEFWEKRHQILVDTKLNKQALAVYKNMDIHSKSVYKRLYGFQKTNYVINYLTERLFFNVEQDKIVLHQNFLQSKMRFNQTARDYIDFLEAQRSRLQQIGINITDGEFKALLMTSLNEHYGNAVVMYDYGEDELERIKAKLLRLKFPTKSDKETGRSSNRGHSNNTRYKNGQNRYFGKINNESETNKYEKKDFQNIANELRRRMKKRDNVEAEIFTNKKKSRPNAIEPDKRNIVCFKCNKKGHYSNECYAKPSKAVAAIQEVEDEITKSDEEWQELIDYESSEDDTSH